MNKKFIFVVTFLLFLMPGFALAAEAMNAAGGINLAKEESHKENAKLRSVVNVGYPKIMGTKLSPAEHQFNHLSQAIVNKEVDEFQRTAEEFIGDMRKNGNPINGNSSIDITYEVVSQKPLASILFTIQSSLIGAAYPNVVHRVLNFDFKTGDVVKLEQLFKPASNYKKVLDEYCAKALGKQLRQSPTEIKERSVLVYDNWNLKPTGILITFDEFPHAIGPMNVLVPYQHLKNILVNSPSSL